MKNIGISLIIILLLVACIEGCAPKKIYNKPDAARRDTVNKKRAANQEIAKVNPQPIKTDQADTINPMPSFRDVLAETVASYSVIENTDDVVIDGKDTLRMHLKFYCLHDSSLILPKEYMAAVWGEKDPKRFVTNNFASRIIIVKNKDTIFNKIIKKSIFNSVIGAPLKKYAILYICNYEGYNKVKGEFAFRYSITIPMTDVGVPASIIVDKKGHYKILDQYATFDRDEKY